MSYSVVHYLIISFGGFIASVVEERADFSAIGYSIFLFMIGCAISLWHSRFLPYNNIN